MSPEMSDSDAELVYKYLNKSVRGDVEAAAWDAVLTEWQDARSDDLDILETAHAADYHPFEWEGICLEVQQREVHGNEDLVPLVDIHPHDDNIVHDLAQEFGWNYVDAVRDEIRTLQESTDYSPREFVTLVLDAAENVNEGIAQREMDISLGNFRGKKGTVASKLETAKETVRVTENIRF